MVDVSPDPGNSAVSLVQIAFNEGVTGVTVGDFVLTRNGSLVDLSGVVLTSVSPQVYELNLGPFTTVDGSYELTLVADGSGIENLFNVPLASDATDVFVVDQIPPTAGFSEVTPDPRATNAGVVTLTFNEEVTGVQISDFSLTRETDTVDISAVALTPQSASAYTLDLSSVTTTDGSYVLTFMSGGASDLASNPTTASALEEFVVDTTPPTATIAEVLPDPSASPVAVIGIDFDEPITGFDIADLSLTQDGLSVDLSSLTVITASSQSYTVDLSSVTSVSGDYELSLSASGSGIADSAGNSLVSNATELFVVDTEPPTVDITDVSPDPRNSPSGTVEIVFSEPVTGFGLEDISLTVDSVPIDLTGVLPALVSAGVYSVDLASVTNAGGAYLLTVSAAGSGISDAAGNLLTTDASDSFVIDLVAPSADIVDVAPDPGSTAATVAINFDEGVTGFDLADLSLTHEGLNVDLSGVPFSATSASQYEVDLSAVTSSSGSYVMTLVASTAGVSDFAGNALVANATENFVIDNDGPIADIVDVDPDPRSNPVGVVTIGFDEDVTGVDVTDFALSRDGTDVDVSSVPFSMNSARSYTIDLSGVTGADGNYLLSLVATDSGIVDSLGNPLGGDVLDSFKIDSIPPVADVVDVSPDPQNVIASTIAIAFGEPVSGVDIDDFTLTLDAVPVDISGFVINQVTSSQYSIDTSSLLSDGEYELTLTAAGSGIQDLAGNLLVTDASDAWILDSVAPTVSLGVVLPDPRSTAVGTVPVSFSEPVTGLDAADFSLTLDGAQLDMGGVPLIANSATSFSLDLSSVTAASGNYVLSIDDATSDAVDVAGNGILQGQSETWVVDVASPTASISEVDPDPTPSVGVLTVEFDEPVTGVDREDFTLTVDGSPVDLAALVVTPVSDTQYTLDLTAYTNAEGVYVLTLVAAGSGVSDSVGNALTSDATETFTVDLRPTAFFEEVQPDPHPGDVGEVVLTFSDDVTGFDPGDLTLTRGGVSVDLSTVTISTNSPSSYAIDLSSVTQSAGTYLLRLVAAGSGIQNLNGEVILDNAVEGFTVDMDVPLAGDDVYITEQGEQLSSVLGADDLLLNDVDPNGGVLTVNSIPRVDVANGSLSLNTNGTFTYLPDPGFSGIDGFTYEVIDGQGFVNYGNVKLTVFEQAITPTAPIQLFDGTLNSFYTFSPEPGSDGSEEYVVEDGYLKNESISDATLITNERFHDYVLVYEFRWTGGTYGARAGKARNSGIQIHSNGVELGWANRHMPGVEVQFAEGSLGDIVLLRGLDADGTVVPMSVTTDTETVNCGPQTAWNCRGGIRWESGGATQVFNNGVGDGTNLEHIHWDDWASNWRDVAGFRGPVNHESPVGEWNQVVVVADGDRLSIHLNGVKVNEARGVLPVAGQIQLQSTFADFEARRFELLPLGSDAGPVLTTDSLPAASVGSAYTRLVNVTAGTAPYTFGVSTGALPSGLTIDSQTGAISGIPTVDGPETFDIVVTDALGLTSTHTFTLQVNPSAVTPKLHVEVANANTTTWSTIVLPHSYSSPVVVGTVATQAGSPPVVPRVRNASGDSFEFKLDRTDGNNAAYSTDVHFMVVEEGSYNVADHGIAMDAFITTSGVTDYKDSWVGEDRRSLLGNSYSSPVVVGQVMSYNDSRWSAFWSRGQTELDPPSTGSVFVGKHVGEDSQKTRLDEELGVIVFEAGTAAIDGYDFVAATGSDSIDGVDALGSAYSISLQDPDFAVASLAGMDGNDGGWAVLFGNSPLGSSISLAIDEDTLGDAERGHTNEQVSYIVFAANDPPVAADDEVSTSEDAALVANVFQNNGNGVDADPESESLAATRLNDLAAIGVPVVLPSGAIVQLDSNGDLDYDPDGSFDYLKVGETATDSFTYTVSDVAGGVDVATVSVTIGGLNDSPTARDDDFATDNVTVINGDVFADNGHGVDFDPDDDDLTVTDVNGSALDVGSVVSLASGALVTLNSDGTFSYDPNGLLTVPSVDSLSYTASDGNGGSSLATIMIAVSGDALPPLATIDETVPDPRNAVLGDVTIRFNEDVAGVDIADFSLVRDGVPVDITSLDLSSVDPQTYTFNLSSVTTVEGSYELALSAVGSGITDVAGNSLVADTSEQFVIDLTEPTGDIIDIAPDPTGPISIVTVRFDEAVSGVDIGDFSLTSRRCPGRYRRAERFGNRFAGVRSRPRIGHIDQW